MRILISLLIFLCAFFALSCGGDTASNTPADDNANIANVPAETEALPASNINAKPELTEEAKRLIALRSQTAARLDISASNTGNVYKAIYTSKPTGKTSTEISIATLESEIYEVKMKNIADGSMFRFTQKSGVLSYDNGKTSVPVKDKRVTKCFAAAQKVVDKYETNLKFSKKQLQDLLWRDCPDFPKKWAIPLDE